MAAHDTLRRLMDFIFIRELRASARMLQQGGCSMPEGEAALEALATQREARQDADARQLLASDYHRASVQVQGKLAELFLHATGSERATP